LGRNLVIECDGAIAVVCDYTSVFEQAATQTNRDAFVAKHTIGIIPDIEPHIERLDIDYDYMFVKYGYRFAVVLVRITVLILLIGYRKISSGSLTMRSHPK